MAKQRVGLLNVTILSKGQAHRAIGVIEILKFDEESKHGESIYAK